MGSNKDTGRWHPSHAERGEQGTDALEGHELKQATATIFLCECGKAHVDVYSATDAQSRQSQHLKVVREVHEAQRQEGNQFE